MQQTQLRTYFFFGLLLLVFVLNVFIFLPYLVTIAMAATFAVVLQPVQREFSRVLKGRERIAAILTILLTIILFLGPLLLIGTKIVHEAQSLYQYLSENPDAVPFDFFSTLEVQLRQYLPNIEINVGRYVTLVVNWVANNIGAWFASTVQLLIHFFLWILAFYYLLVDGQKFIGTIRTLSPLPDKHDLRIFHRLETAINSIIRGTLLIALLQGVTSGIGLAIFGVPSPTLWGSMAAIGAFVPGVGTAIVLAPAVIFLFLTDQFFAGVGLAIWSATAVGMIDNFIGPILVGRGVKIHPFFILFSVIGGIELFGPLGFILGPLMLSFLYALVDIYSLVFLKRE